MDEIFVNLREGDKSFPPIIFLHGDYQNHTVFRRLEDYFIRKNHTTVTLDFPGHGLSQAKELDLSLLIEDVVLENKLQKPVIIGNSFGGLLAIDYAKKNSITSLTLINSPIFDMTNIYPDINWSDKLNEYQVISDKFFEKQFLVDYSNTYNFSDDEIAGIGIKTTSPIGFKNNVIFYRSFYGNHNIDIKFPTLLIVSENDWLIPKNNAMYWIDKHENRKIELVNANHNVLIQNPLMVLNILDKHYSFLSGETK